MRDLCQTVKRTSHKRSEIECVSEKSNFAANRSIVWYIKLKLLYVYAMETHDMEMPVPEAKPRNRKGPVFGQLSIEEEEAMVPENSIDNYMPPSASSQSSRSRQTSECSTLIPNLPNLGGNGMGGTMLNGPMRPKLVQQPVRRKSSIFRRIRDKLKRGSLISSSTADSTRSSASIPTASAGANQGIAGILQGNLLNAELADKLFKSAAAVSIAPIEGCQEYYSDLYQQQQSICQEPYNNPRKKSSKEDEEDESGSALIASTELAHELKIPAREVGYILRSLGQNPTEDEINNLICEAGCDWEGFLSADDFLSVALVSMQKDAQRMDDVRAAFRAFDKSGDGVISRDELKKAMQMFGHSFTEDECDEMFMQADLNSDGVIDWDEFISMMSPGDITNAK